MLGGAALTRQLCRAPTASKSYGPGRVAYARDAFDGLTLMDMAVTGGLDEYLAERQAKRMTNEKPPTLPDQAMRPVDWEQVKTRKSELHDDFRDPRTAVLGPEDHRKSRTEGIGAVPVRDHALSVPVGLQEGRAQPGRMEGLGEGRTDPVLTRMLDICGKEDILQAQAAYGYWKCASEGNDVILFNEDGTTEVGRFGYGNSIRKGVRIAKKQATIDLLDMPVAAPEAN